MTYASPVRRFPKRKQSTKPIQRRKGILAIGAFAFLQAALLGNTRCPIVASAFVATRSPVASKCHHHRQSNSNPQCRYASKTVAMAGNNENEEMATIGMDNDFENMDILRDLVVASSLSYLSSEAEVGEDGSLSMSKMEASPYYSQQLKPLVQVVDPKTESGATIFEYNDLSAQESDATILVACRGSATPVNFSTNLRFKLVPLLDKETESTNSDFLVHEGFQDATNGLWRLLAPELERLWSGNTAYSGVVFTGHSLGAANALLCATNYQKGSSSSKTSSAPPLGGVITFGGPRLVNTDLADYWNANLLQPPVVVKNYVHSKDPILRQNGPLWDSLGFGIVGAEIPCEPFQARAYHSQQEQEYYNSKDLPLAWNILDHCNYLGIFVGPRLL